MSFVKRGKSVIYTNVSSPLLLYWLYEHAMIPIGSGPAGYVGNMSLIAKRCRVQSNLRWKFEKGSNRQHSEKQELAKENN